MAIERDETDIEWPTATDSINAALCPLFEVIFAHTHDGSPERKAAMGEVLQIAERIKQALAPKPRLQ